MASACTPVDVGVDRCSATDARRLSSRRLWRFASPVAGVGLMWSLVGFYFLKYATDVLGVAPVLVGALFAAARVWDAISDALAGAWSDRTRTRFGRRRPWIAGSALPLAAVSAALWMPPVSLGGLGVGVWVGVCMLLFYTALTAFMVPQLSLGAELAVDTDDRTRVFTVFGLCEMLGGLAGIAILAWVVSDPAQIRSHLGVAAVAIGVASAALVFFSVSGVREPPGHLGRGGVSLRASLRDVARNAPARVLLASEFLHTLGVVCAMNSVSYVTEYVLGDARWLPVLLLAFTLAALVSVPVWGPLSRRFGKREVLICAGGVQALVLGALFFGPEVGSATLVALLCATGAMEGANSVLGRSLKGDVIELDAARTGERKEGAYFAAWNIGSKTALALAALAVGAVLQLAGFEPGAAQSQTSLLGMRLLVSAVPGGLVMIACLWLLKLRIPAPGLRAAPAGSQKSQLSDRVQ